MKYERKLVGQVLGSRGNLNNHIGIELEIEGSRLPEVSTSFWKSERDGSLRGESFEYVLRKPIPFDKTKEALNEIQKEWDGAESRIKDSPNAGTHIHINCSDLTVTQLFNYVSLYLVVENILVDTCGIDRIGNLFCLRSGDAEFLVDSIVQAVREADLSVLHTDDLRYASINLKALGDYGSIEFRAWRSDGDLEAVAWWASLLQHLKEKAKAIDNPALIVANVSEMRPTGFFSDILGPFAKDIPWKDEYEGAIVDSVRRVQQYAFLGDW